MAIDDAMRIVGICSLEDHGDHFQLEHVWIDPDAQGVGIGSTLVRRALLAASKRPVPVRLVADQYAEGFYERLGAQVVGRLPAPMPGDPEQSLSVMEFRTKASLTVCPTLRSAADLNQSCWAAALRGRRR